MAGFISDEDIQKVRDATDIVSLISERTPVKQKGRDFWACCPLHQEKTPSFKMDPSTQLWHCFGCDEGGDVFGFVMKADGLTFPEAVLKLAERAHIDIEQTNVAGMARSETNRLKEVCDKTASFYHMQLMRLKSAEAAKAREYLAGRNMGGTVPKRWMLGFAPGRSSLISHLRKEGFNDEEMTKANVAITSKNGSLRDRFFNRVMFPIFNVSGECIAFGGRVIGQGEPKYLNSQETPIFHKSKVLYGLDKAKAAMASTGTAIVTEGYTDVIAMHEAGICNVVATLGTALTRDHIRLLSRHARNKIVYIFDGDEAGQRATERALQFIDETISSGSGKRYVELCALCLPDNLDPFEYLQAHSRSEMERLIDSAKPLIQFGIERRLMKHDKTTAEGRARALSAALDVLAPIKDSIIAKDYAAQIADELGYRIDDVLIQLSKVKAPQNNTFEQSYADKSEALQTNMVMPVNVSQANQSRRRLTSQEKNRLSIERQYLGLAAQNPSSAVAYASALESVKWHDPIHKAISASMLECLMENLDASAVEVIEACSSNCPQAANILTKPQLPMNVSADEALRYLTEELEISDIQNDLNILKSRLRDDVSSEGASAEIDLFDRVVSLQGRLSELKSQHVPMKSNL